MTTNLALDPANRLAGFSGKKILITGGLGFIGSNLARDLVGRGAEVTVVDSLIPVYGGNLRNVEDIKSRIGINISDVRDPYSMAHLVAGKDYLFNLAGQTSHLDSMTDPQTDLEINAAAQLSILEACRKHNPAIKIVFASTRQIYGKPEYLPVNENHPIRPVDVNGVNKAAGEWYHILYNNVYRIRTCALRLTNTYGPGMRVKDARQTFLGIWIRRCVERTPFLVYGDGSQLRDFNYVDDVVTALLLAALSPGADGRIFNLGSREITSLGDLAAMLSEMTTGGSYQMVEFPANRKAIDIGNYYSDYGEFERAVGWTPAVLLREGLRKTLDYYEANRAYYWEQGT